MQQCVSARAFSTALLVLVLLGVLGCSLSGQIYQESCYQLMLNYGWKSNTLSFQPERRVQNFVERTTTSLWRLLFIRQWDQSVHTHLGMDWFNLWHDYAVTSHEVRAHIEAGFRTQYGAWTYLNRYRLDCRNYFDADWQYEKTVFRLRYMANWSTDIYRNESGQRLILFLADEVFLNVGGSTRVPIYDQNRLGGYLVYHISATTSLRGTYWWEYRGKDHYNHQVWFQVGYEL